MTRLRRLVAAMRRFYGRLPAPPDEAFTLFVWDVLAARTTPRRRDAALAALRRIPALTPDSMWRAPQGKLEASVKAAGSAVDERLQALRTGAAVFRRHPDLDVALSGPLLAARRALSVLPQPAEGTVHRLLLFAASHRVLPMDVGTLRVATRLGYAPSNGVYRRRIRAARRALAAELQPDVAAYRETATYLSHHAFATCTTGDPHCAVCPVVDECPAAAGVS